MVIKKKEVRIDKLTDGHNQNIFSLITSIVTKSHQRLTTS